MLRLSQETFKEVLVLGNKVNNKMDSKVDLDLTLLRMRPTAPQMPTALPLKDATPT
jgi:hypothetical protein